MMRQGSGATPMVLRARALETSGWLFSRPRGAIRDLALGSRLLADGWDKILTERLHRLGSDTPRTRRPRRRSSARRRFLVTGPMLRAECRAARRALRDLKCILDHAADLDL